VQAALHRLGEARLPHRLFPWNSGSGRKSAKNQKKNELARRISPSNPALNTIVRTQDDLS